MFKGSVTFVASIKGNGLTFPKLEFVPQGTAIEKVDIEGPNGSEIRSTIYLSSVASPEVGKTLAAQ